MYKNFQELNERLRFSEHFVGHYSKSCELIQFMEEFKEVKPKYESNKRE